MVNRKSKAELTMVLAGAPNVGKSAIFHQITGADVIISNYPGTTVELIEGRVSHRGYDIRVIDLPGIYSLSAASEDEMVARLVILEWKPDVVINILDASNLERSLYLTLQLLELGLPMIILLNMYDVALSKGIRLDPKLLSKILGVPVIETVAIRGENVAKAFDEAIRVAVEKARPEKVVEMSRDIEAKISHLSREIQKLPVTPFDLPARALAVKLLEGDGHLAESLIRLTGSEEVLRRADELALEILREYGEPSAYRISRERHRIAALISREITEHIPVKPGFSQRLDNWMTCMRTGLPIMFLVFASLILLLIYVGGFLEEMLVEGWTIATSGLRSAFEELGSMGQMLNIGLLQGIEGILAVMFPYILPFFLALGLVEDVGYLPRIAFIMDWVAHKLGLHGKAIIPMLGGFGCNVPAIMATRVLATRRERLISGFLITMIPCSARTAVILGSVGFFLGAKYALMIYGIVIALIFMLGWLLNKWLPGQASGMIMEIPPLRRPMLKNILEKTWMRMKHFLYIAAPLLLMGSFLIGALQVSGAMDLMIWPISPLTTGWLGLPPAAIVPLIYGFIRKEGALVLLVAIAGSSNLLEFMTPLQLFVFSLVVTIYVPCIATEAVLARELGWKNAVVITIGSFLIALIVGGVFHHLNPLQL